MFKEALRPVWAEINLTDLEYNIDRIKEKIGDSKLIGVIKADAYGHGAVKYAQILQKKGCEIFAIATLQEAITLREAGFKEDIIMLGLVPDMYADTVVKYDIIPAVCDSENVRAFDEEAHRQGKVCKVIIAADTGMAGSAIRLTTSPPLSLTSRRSMNFPTPRSWVSSHTCPQQTHMTRHIHTVRKRSSTSSATQYLPQASDFPSRPLQTQHPSWNFLQFTSMHAVQASSFTDSILQTK
jgi:alanine racemase